eukprot:TRINITY_DN36477_c0_g1_i1.p1 TRINITY_DN36477_c0_g1~~TRINITY_DN36477_c0_g1_i1.p1  ORF type:complete len:429 (+),score=84.16 TRINITY_DN36477_c0_g1_i1:51-1289(+)
MPRRGAAALSLCALLSSAHAACPAAGCGSFGTCDTATDTCTCHSGYAGEACDACAPPFFNYPTCDVVCDTSTCLGRGTCNAQGKCECECSATGACWAGLNCEHCGAHHYGANCDVVCDPSVTCRGMGSCASSGSCSCTTGLCGADCSQCCAADTYNWPSCDVTCTDAATCSGHGSCQGPGGACACDVGFLPPTCGECAEADRYYGYPTCTRCPSTPGAPERWTGTECVALPSPTPAPFTPAPATSVPQTPSPPPGTTPQPPPATPQPPSSGDGGTDVAWWLIMLAVCIGVVSCAAAAWWKLRKLKAEAAASPQGPLGEAVSANPIAVGPGSAVPMGQVISPQQDVAQGAVVPGGQAQGIPLMVDPSSLPGAADGAPAAVWSQAQADAAIIGAQLHGGAVPGALESQPSVTEV